MGHCGKKSKSIQARQIRRQLAQINPSNSYHQKQSPLFSKIPPELRNLVFNLVVSEHDDLSRPFSPYYPYRPLGWKFYKKTCTELLRTCRLVYYETNSIPMSSSNHLLPIQFTRSTKPFSLSTKSWLARLTSKNVAELNHVHHHDIGTNKAGWESLLSLPQFQPRHVSNIVPAGQKLDCTWDWKDLDNTIAAATQIAMPVSLETYTLEVHITKFSSRPLDTQFAKLLESYKVELSDGRILQASIEEAEKPTREMGPVYPSTWNSSPMCTLKLVFTEQETRHEMKNRRGNCIGPFKLPIHLNKRRKELITCD